jgi:DNA-directed RNA polymerase subunit RPC12/RpoP
MIERQELFCHACGRYVQFNIDKSLNGNHEIRCPNCGHLHYRYVDNGIITDRRWGSSNGQMNYVSNTTSSASTIALSTGSTNMYQSWLNTTTTSSASTGHW